MSGRLRFVLVSIVLLTSAIVSLGQAGPQGLWTPIPNLPSAQAFQTATSLPDNTIVEAGGLMGTDTFWPNDSTAAAAWYLPGQNGWVPLPSMAQDRFLHGAAYTTANKMIVAGGYTSTVHPLVCLSCNTCGPQPQFNSITNTVETFDEDSLSWSMAAPMNDGRAEFSMVRLSNGLVLAAGGGGQSAELYNPSINIWTPARNMNANRVGAATTLLSDGRVFVAGGDFGNDDFGFPVSCGPEAEVYDPASNTWTNTGGMTVNHYRGTASEIRLPDGSHRVLVAGGMDGNASGMPVVSTAEIWNPSTNAFTSAENMLVPRAYHAAIVRDDGKVLITGGINEIGDTENRAEVYDPATNTWSLAAPMIFPHVGQTAVNLGPSYSGKIVIAGGANWTFPTVFAPNAPRTFFPTATAEIYQETPIASTTTIDAQPLPVSNAISACQPGSVQAFVGSSTGLGTPTGRVSFFDYGAFFLSPSLNNGIAVLPALLDAGTHEISAKYSGDSNFSASNSATVTVESVAPPIVVSGPTTTTAGTPITLTASAPVGAVAPYTFVWTLPNGANVFGNSVMVTPAVGQNLYAVNGSDSDSCNLNPATFTVNGFPAGVSLLVQVTSLFRDSQGNIEATFTVTNQGADTAASLQVTTSALNTTPTTFPLPVTLGSLAAGAQTSFLLGYPGSAAAAGTQARLAVTLTYVDSVTGNAGNLNASFRITAP